VSYPADRVGGVLANDRENDERARNCSENKEEDGAAPATGLAIEKCVVSRAFFVRHPDIIAP
jgi:hypothetical protein